MLPFSDYYGFILIVVIFVIYTRGAIAIEDNYKKSKGIKEKVIINTWNIYATLLAFFGILSGTALLGFSNITALIGISFMIALYIIYLHTKEVIS